MQRNTIQNIKSAQSVSADLWRGTWAVPRTFPGFGLFDLREIRSRSFEAAPWTDSRTTAPLCFSGFRPELRRSGDGLVSNVVTWPLAGFRDGLTSCTGGFIHPM